MLNPQWVIKRPQLEKRSAWISIYLLINSECAFVNFIVPGPQPGLGSLYEIQMCLIQHQHSNLALCFVENFIQQTWTHAGVANLQRWLDLWTDRFLKNYTHSSRGERPSALSSLITHIKTRHASGRHLSPACMPGCGSLLEKIPTFYQNIHNQGCWWQL